MTFRTLIGALGVMALGLLAPTRAEALMLTVEDFVVVVGETTDVTATVQWEVGDPDPLSLDGFNVSLAPGLSVDTTPFFATWPLTLATGGSFTGVLFTVTAILGTPAGTTAGSATFFASGGGVPIEDTTDGFAATVVPDTATVVPEPTTLLLLGTGLLAAGLQRRRR
jgi:hypothetical protein